MQYWRYISQWLGIFVFCYCYLVLLLLSFVGDNAILAIHQPVTGQGLGHSGLVIANLVHLQLKWDYWILKIVTNIYKYYWQIVPNINKYSQLEWDNWILKILTCKDIRDICKNFCTPTFFGGLDIVRQKVYKIAKLQSVEIQLWFTAIPRPVPSQLIKDLRIPHSKLSTWRETVFLFKRARACSLTVNWGPGEKLPEREIESELLYNPSSNSSATSSWPASPPTWSSR